MTDTPLQRWVESGGSPCGVVLEGSRGCVSTAWDGVLEGPTGLNQSRPPVGGPPGIWAGWTLTRSDPAGLGVSLVSGRLKWFLVRVGLHPAGCPPWDVFQAWRRPRAELGHLGELLLLDCPQETMGFPQRSRCQGEDCQSLSQSRIRRTGRRTDLQTFEMIEAKLGRLCTGFSGEPHQRCEEDRGVGDLERSCRCSQPCSVFVSGSLAWTPTHTPFKAKRIQICGNLVKRNNQTDKVSIRRSGNLSWAFVPV